MGNKTNRRLTAQYKRLAGKEYPPAPLVFYGTRADLFRTAIRQLGEEPHS